jgi:hypothetical protein
LAIPQAVDVLTLFDKSGDWQDRWYCLTEGQYSGTAMSILSKGSRNRMDFIDSPTEQTTAITDVILMIMAVAAAVYLRQIGLANPWKSRVWVWAFGLLAVAAALGAVVHGFVLSEETYTALIQPLNFTLGMLVALFVVAVVFDLWGRAVAGRVLPFALLTGVGFFALTLVWPDRFLVFIIYEILAMLFALGGYILLAGRGTLAGAWLMVAGVFVTIVAAAVQVSKAVSFTLVWPFDHNGIYHLIQMVAILLLVAGLRRSLQSW